MSTRPFSSFKLLSFDIYGTLIDWECGITTALAPLLGRLDTTTSDIAATISYPLALPRLFNRHERAIQEASPALLYSDVLAQAYVGLGHELGVFPGVGGDKSRGNARNRDDALPADIQEEAAAFGQSVGAWPAFSDTVNALRRLRARGFRLVVLSNVDRESFGRTLTGPFAELLKAKNGEGESTPTTFFDGIYTAQDIGSYKPALANFEYLIEHVRADFGVAKDEILHVAQSLLHDHAPASTIGLESAWIARGEAGGASGMGGDLEEYLGGENPKARFTWRFNSMGEFADAVEREEKGGQE